MARYIDADALYNKLYPLDLVDKKTYAINAKAVADAIAKTPTADVVARAEYNRVYFNLKAVLEERAETKAEIAMEIFEEIEENADFLFDGFRNIVVLTEKDFEKLKKKYPEGGDQE